MNKVVSSIFFGRGNAFSGAIAFGIVALIALGCTCGKNFDLGNLGSGNSNSGSSSNIFSDPDKKTRSGSKPTVSDSLIPPPDDQLQYLARETMLDFNKAVTDADFTDFYDSVASVWQKQTSPEGMKTSFQSFIDGKASFGEISDMDATLSTRQVSKEGKDKMLEVDGKYPTSPNPTTFELKYIAEGREWKLIRIKVLTTIYSRK